MSTEYDHFPFNPTKYAELEIGSSKLSGRHWKYVLSMLSVKFIHSKFSLMVSGCFTSMCKSFTFAFRVLCLNVCTFHLHFQGAECVQFSLSGCSTSMFATVSGTLSSPSPITQVITCPFIRGSFLFKNAEVNLISSQLHRLKAAKCYFYCKQPTFNFSNFTAAANKVTL